MRNRKKLLLLNAFNKFGEMRMRGRDNSNINIKLI